MDHLNTSPNWHIAHIFDWSITPQQFSHLSLPVANWHRRKDSAISFFFPKRLLDTRDQMVCLRMSLVASCYVWQCGLIWQLSVLFFLPSRRSNWENSTWIDFIPHSAHSKYFWQRHMVERSAQQQAAQPQGWAVFTSFQETRASNVCNVCMQAGDRQQAGRRAGGAHCFSSSTQTQRQMINLCRTTNIPPNKILLRPFFFMKPHNVYKCNSARCSILVIKSYSSSLHKIKTTYLQTTTLHWKVHCEGGSSNAASKFHLSHPVFRWTNL